MKLFGCIAKYSAAVTLALASYTASATPVYEYTDNTPPSVEIKNISTRYDHDNQKFSWKSSFSTSTNGGWLVISDGPFPVHNNDPAIFYIDLAANKLAVYEYNANVGRNSYQQEQHIATYDGIINTSVNGDLQTIDFNLDVSGINALLDDGVQFGSEVGVWFQVGETSFAYNADGSLANFSLEKQLGLYDVKDRQTVEVDAPNTMLLLGLALSALAMIGNRRRKQTTPVNLVTA